MSGPLFLLLPDSVEGMRQVASLTNVERRGSSLLQGHNPVRSVAVSVEYLFFTLDKPR